MAGAAAERAGELSCKRATWCCRHDLETSILAAVKALAWPEVADGLDGLAGIMRSRNISSGAAPTPIIACGRRPSIHFEAAEALLKPGADVNFQSSRRVTALHCMLKKNSRPSISGCC
jgi:hypothetical protein